MLYFVSQVSLRQAITPLEILGSVNASNRFITRGAMPLGGVIGGVLGSYLGLKMSLFIFAVGFFLSTVILCITSIYKIRSLNMNLNL